MLGICQYPSLVPVDSFSEDNSHVFNKWNRKGMCKEWHYQCAKKLLALRLRILGTIIDITGPQIFQNLGDTSQLKRRKDDVKRISYQWHKFLAQPYKIQSPGILKLLNNIVFIVFGRSVGFDRKWNFYEYAFKKLEIQYHNKNYLFNASMGDFGLSFWLTFMQYLDSVTTVKPFQVFWQTSFYCCCCVLLLLLLLLLLTLQPYMLFGLLHQITPGFSIFDGLAPVSKF